MGVLLWCAVLRHRLLSPASQPPNSWLAALDAGGRLRNNALARRRAVCEREQRTRTQTYLTRCCNTAAAGCCTPDGRRAVSYAAMRTCLSQLEAGVVGLQ